MDRPFRRLTECLLYLPFRGRKSCETDPSLPNRSSVQRSGCRQCQNVKALGMPSFPCCRNSRKNTPVSILPVRAYATDNGIAPNPDALSAARRKYLDDALEQIAKDFGEGAIMKLGDNRAVPVEVIPTGSECPAHESSSCPPSEHLIKSRALLPPGSSTDRESTGRLRITIVASHSNLVRIVPLAEKGVERGYESERARTSIT
jgi:hypothetical protein